jgi:hypothetical protein
MYSFVTLESLPQEGLGGLQCIIMGLWEAISGKGEKLGSVGVDL